MMLGFADLKSFLIVICLIYREVISINFVNWIFRCFPSLDVPGCYLTKMCYVLMTNFLIIMEKSVFTLVSITFSD